ncbi:MAG: hypothetical protein PHX61_06970 [Alphaproteobacteria bacterium]|nr:hypothetical protein [Alphaproteobacteria bacterium]
MSEGSVNGREIFYEIKVIAGIAKVSAVDAATGIEAIIQGPRSSGEALLKRTALNKLIYLLRKQGII